MSMSPHPVVCSKVRIMASKVGCEQAREAVQNFLDSDPATITSVTLGGLNHLVNCHDVKCIELREEVRESFPIILG